MLVAKDCRNVLVEAGRARRGEFFIVRFVKKDCFFVMEKSEFLILLIQPGIIATVFQKMKVKFICWQSKK
ncbi:hypothetical protein [Oenococcus oeni]|uniref:hypothetical protein n=1 Tax=Oenococcus oeni TaxID=1247 RepID=UPI000AD8B8AF|nr:hypothetical protein [Oenococcus oeni]